MSKISSQTVETGRNGTTRDRIFSDSEVRAMVNSYRDYVLQVLVPLALRVIERNLKSRRPNPLLAIEVLKGAQVHLTKPEHGSDGREDPFAKMTNEELDAFVDSAFQKWTATRPPLTAVTTLHSSASALMTPTVREEGK